MQSMNITAQTDLKEYESFISNYEDKIPYLNSTIFKKCTQSNDYFTIGHKQDDQIIGIHAFKIIKEKKFTKAILDSRQLGVSCLSPKKAKEYPIILANTLARLKSSGVDEVHYKIYHGEDVGIGKSLTSKGFKLNSANCDFVLTLPTQLDDLIPLFSVSRRNEVRQSLKKDTVVKSLENKAEFIEVFLEIYQKTQSRKNIKSIGKEELESVLNSMDNRNLVAYIDGVPAAAVLFTLAQKTVYYHYSALDIEFSKHRPVDRIIYELLVWAMQNNYRYCNFMSTSLDALSGVYSFKKQWGGETFINLTYSKPLSFKMKLKEFVRNTLNLFRT
jgi:hypothetical protein